MMNCIIIFLGLQDDLASHDAELLGCVDVFRENAEISIEVIALFYLMGLHKAGLDQPLHVLGDRCLSVVEDFHQVLGAHGGHFLIAMHDIAEQSQPYRVRQRIGNGGDELCLDPLEILCHALIPSDSQFRTPFRIRIFRSVSFLRHAAGGGHE